MTVGDPIPAHLVRALAYVNLANLGGGAPTRADLDAFAQDEVPAPGRRMSFYDYATSGLHKAIYRSGSYEFGEPVAEYMVALGWLEEGHDGGLQVTALGRAVLHGFELAETESAADALTVIFPEDPLHYAALTRAIASAGAGLLFDPYFKPDMLPWLGSSTTIRRVLVLEATRNNKEKEEQKLFPMYLGGLEEAAGIEVRITSSETFHDRGVLHEDDQVSLIGTSLTGIGKHVTTIIPLPQEAGEPVREHIEALWSAAQPVEAVEGLQGSAIQVPGIGTPTVTQSEPE